MLDHNNPSRVPWALLFSFLSITIIITIAGFYIYNAQKAEIKSNIYSELSFISKTKLEQVIEWRNDRLSDASKIEGDQSFIYDVQKWLRNKNEKGPKQRIEKLIGVIQRDSNYANIYLIDDKFNIRLAWGGNEKLSQFAKKNLIAASETKKILLTDLHKAETYSQIHLDLNIPLFLTSEKGEDLVGLIMIRVIPDKRLYRTIQSWPTPSRSAETLLIRKENDHVLFLNELRHKKNTALTLTSPLSDALLPATQAALGFKGIFEGIDYRGIRVLSDLVQIPGTNWSMVTKVDLEEIYSPLRERAVLIFLLALSLVIIAFVTSVLVWRHQRSVFYKEKFRLETERRVLEKQFAYLIKNANDIILLLNEGGQIIEANDKALSTYNFTRDELLELNISDVRSEETMALVTRQLNDITVRGGLIYETVHRKKDGTTFPVEVSSRSIEIENAIYYQSIVRDITERKQAEAKIERLNRMYALLSQINQVIVRTKEREKLFNEICEIAIKFGKFNMAWFGLIDYEKKNINIIAASPNKDETIKDSVVNYSGTNPNFLVFAEAINNKMVAVKNDIHSGKSLSDSIVESQDWGFRSVAVTPIKFENTVIGVFTFYSSTANYFDTEQIRLFEEVGLDISFALENMKAGETLLEDEIKFRNLFENTPVGIVMLDKFDKIISINKGFENIFQYSLNEIKGCNINDVVAPDQFVDEARSLSAESLKGLVVEKESLRKRKDGSIVNVYIYGVPIVANKQQIGIYGMYLDITERKVAETNLRENQKLLTTVVENVPVGIWLFDDKGNIMHGNSAAQEIWSGVKYIGIEKFEEYKAWFVNTGKKIGAEEWAATRCLRTGETIINEEIEIECFDGQHKFILNSALPIIDSHKKIAGVIAVNQDITKRKRIEKQLEEERNTLRTLVDTLPDRIYFKDKECKFLLNNISHIKALGSTTQKEVLGKTDFDFRSHERAQRSFEDDLKVIKTGEPLINWEENIILESGEKRWNLVSKVPLKDDKGNVTGLVGISHDITNRKFAEEELVKSVSLLQATLDSTTDGLLVVNSEGKIIQFNRRFIELWRIPEDVLATKEDNKALAFVLDQLKYPELFLSKVNDLYHQPEATSFDLLEFKDGRVFERYSQPQSINGKSVGRVWSFRDITERKKSEAALIESEEKFRSFAEESPNMIFINKQGRVVYANRKCVEIMGYTREEFLDPNFNFLDLIAPEFVENVKENFTKRYKGEAKDSYEYALITKDKKRIEVTIASAMINYEGGRAILGTISDITERKQFENALKESEEKFRNIYETANEGICVTNTSEEIVSANKKFRELVGYSVDEITGKNFEIFVHGEEITDYKKRQRNRQVGNKDIYERRLLRKDGSTIWTIVAASPILDANNSFSGSFGMFTDITERKFAEEEIRKLYRGVEQSPAAVVITDKLGNIEYVNAKFCDTTGYSLTEVIGNNPRLLKSGEKTKDEYETLWKTILSGNEWRGEFHNKKKNGELYWEFASISPIKNEKGVITHFIAIKEDITDRKRMIEELILVKDKAEKSEKIKTEFLAQMSHEIRTPINIILGFNSFIKDELRTNITGELSESFDSIESASKRIIRTVDMILNMSEIQTKTVTVSPEIFDLDKEMFSALCVEYKKQAERKNLSFTYSVLTDNTKIFTDSYLTTHIFTNLIDNAVKYTDKGKIEIIVNRYNQNKLYVEVKDTGIGISEEFIPKLFDPFTQEEHGYSRKYEGNGLGLALVKNYCELNNAQIEVESIKGTGTTFRVIFG